MMAVTAACAAEFIFVQSAFGISHFSICHLWHAYPLAVYMRITHLSFFSCYHVGMVVTFTARESGATNAGPWHPRASDPDKEI